MRNDASFDARKILKTGPQEVAYYSLNKLDERVSGDIFSHEDGETREFRVRARVDSPVEVEYLRNGGILQTVLRQILKER